MSEVPGSGGVTFAALRPVEYIKLPPGSLAEFLPTDTREIHAAIDDGLSQPEGLELFLAAELSCDPLPWAEGRLYAEDVDRVKGWSEGFKSKLGFLRQLEAFIEPRSSTTIAPEELSFVVRNAVAIYLEMVELTAAVKGWPEEALLDARAKVLAELSMADKTHVWQAWNKRLLWNIPNTQHQRQHLWSSKTQPMSWVLLVLPWHFRGWLWLVLSLA